MVIWDIWFIDEGFLVWIIPLVYQSHESIIWACTASFVHTCIYRMLDISSHVYMCQCSRHHILMHVFWFRFINTNVLTWFQIYYWFSDFQLCYWLLPLSVCLNHITWSCTRVTAWARQLVLSYVLVGLLSDNPGSSCPDPKVWIVVALL